MRSSPPLILEPICNLNYGKSSQMMAMTETKKGCTVTCPQRYILSTNHLCDFIKRSNSAYLNLDLIVCELGRINADTSVGGEFILKPSMGRFAQHNPRDIIRL